LRAAKVGVGVGVGVDTAGFTDLVGLAVGVGAVLAEQPARTTARANSTAPTPRRNGVRRWRNVRGRDIRNRIDQ